MLGLGLKIPKMLINSYSFNGGGGVAIPTANLIMYLRFNNSLTDETGNHTSSGSNGITYTNGIYSGTANEAAVFDADLDYIRFPDDNALSFGNGSTDSPFSFSTCVYFTGDSGDAVDFIIMKRGNNATGNSGVLREWQFFRRISSGALCVTLFDDSTGGSIGKESTTALSDSTAYHVAVTYDGSGYSGLKIYINGVLEGSYTDSSSGSYTAMENLTAPVILGSAGWLYTNPVQTNEFIGYLDGLAFWDKELSQAEVTAIYNEQAAGNELL